MLSVLRCVLLSLILFAIPSTVFSAVKTWTGNGSDNLFSNPANWAENSGAAYGDDLVFPAVSARYNPNNNLLMQPGPGTTQFYRTLTITGGNYTFSGRFNITNGITVNGGNQIVVDGPPGISIYPSIYVAEGASITAGVNVRYSSFLINGPGNAVINCFGSSGNYITKNDSGTTNLRWTDGNNLLQIDVNGGRLIAQGGMTGALTNFNVTNGIVEGYIGNATRITFNGSGATYRSNSTAFAPTVEFINGARFAPTNCAVNFQAGSLNLTGSVLDLSSATCPNAINNLFFVFGSSPTVTGTFSNYSEGSRINIGEKTYRLTYRGGDGNDVQLIRVVTPFDFDGDLKTDVSVFRPGDGTWWYQRSSDLQVGAVQFGVSTDRPTPGDFTGDGKTDIAFWRPSSGEWFILRSEDGSYFAFPFGTNGDVPVPADYDGDGKTDTAVFRPSTATWFILRSGGGGVANLHFGLSTDKPVAADYDGDGKTDIAIFRPSDGNWWYLRSSDNQVRVFNFGVSTDRPVPGDFTGDGRADIAVWRPTNGEWFVLRSEDNSYFSFLFGSNEDVPVPGDYDGDGRTDAAIFRPATANWFVNRSTGGTLIQQFGINSDTPVPSVFVP